MLSRKAQGLSLNAIIIAVIVLVVLIIIVSLTTGYFSSWRVKFGKISDTSCKSQGGTVKSQCIDNGEIDVGGSYDDVKDGQVCCVVCGRQANERCCKTATPCNPGSSGFELVCKNDVCVKGP